ncbi:MAG: hypothetical protein AB1444_01410 [Spirochaetota bacterium]
MAGTIKIVIVSCALAILCCGFAIPVHVSAATIIPSSGRLRIIEATKKASQNLAAMKAMHRIEEEAMLALHSYTIKAGGNSFSIHNEGISFATIHIPPLGNVFPHSSYSHTSAPLCLVYVLFLAVAYCYERFYYRQREAYPPCEFLCYKLSHIYIYVCGICCITSKILATPGNLGHTINISFLPTCMAPLPCNVFHCMTVSCFLSFTHSKTSTSQKAKHIPISRNDEVRL